MRYYNMIRAMLFGGILCFSPAIYSELMLDVEYLPEDDYESAFGVGLYQLKDEGVGLYGNVQATLTEREPHYESLNVNSFGDPVTARYKDIAILNFGLTRKFSDHFSGYLGLGFAEVTGMAAKFDPTYILSSDGTYYVDDPTRDESGGNVNAGLIVSFGRVGVNLGYHSFTQSAYLGVGASF